jgi:hypothetical protein
MSGSPSQIQMTGRNALIAVGIALGITVILTAVYALIGAVLYRVNGDEVSLSWVLNDALSIFKLIGFCGAPILFILAFALLQRFRIR